LGSLSANALNQNDLDLLILLSALISTTIKNILAFTREKLRSDELDGIINFINSISELQDPEELFCRLVEALHWHYPEIFGFLLYDEIANIKRATSLWYSNEFITICFEIKNSTVDDLIHAMNKFLQQMQ
jgi:hypothetical protein